MKDRFLIGLTWFSGFDCRAPIVATGPLLPLMMSDLHLSATLGGLMTSLPLLVMAILSIPAGLISDRVGPRWMLVLSQFAIALFGAARGLSTNEGILLAAVFMLGAAVSFSQPALAQIAHLRERVATTTAIYVNGMMSGSLVAGLLSGTWLLSLAGGLSWRGVFLLWAVLGLVCMLLWSRIPIPKAKHQVGPTAPREGIIGPLKEVWTIPGIRAVSLAFAAQSAIFFGFVTWSSAYEVSRGSSIALAALPVVAVSVSSIVGNILSPHLPRYFGGTRRLLLWASALTIASQIGLLLDPSWITLWAWFSGFGTAMVFTLCMAMPAQVAAGSRVGAASGFLLLVGYVGSSISPVVMGAIHDLTGSFGGDWWLLLAVALVMWLAVSRAPHRAFGAEHGAASG